MMGGLKLSTSSQCIKYLMFIFNLLFLITGIILLSIGSVIHGVYYNYQHFLDNRFLSVPSLLIAVGSIIFFIAFFGCCGALRENYCMIITFASLMVLIFIMELSAGISGYVLRSNAKELIQQKMETSMNLYMNTTEHNKAWDALQEEFQCCGAVRPEDWIEVWKKLPNATLVDEGALPTSCCPKLSGTVGNFECRLKTATAYKSGCLDSLAAFIKRHAVQLGGAGLGIAFVQLTGAMIVSVGTTIYAVYNDFSHFLDSSYFSPATVLIIVGALIFVIAFCGCCGAVKESTCMVLTFAVSLSAVLILEFSAAISAYTLQVNITKLLNDKINSTMYQYEYNPEAKNAIDFLQSKLNCCGYNGASDWTDVLMSSNNSITVPLSCCNRYASSNTETEASVCPYVFQNGCYHSLSVVVSRSALYLITGAMMIALIQLAGIMFACMLGRAIRKQKTEREKRRWQMRESLLNGYEPLGKTNPFATFPIVYMNNNDFKEKIPAS